ncbi:alpha/beta hydrolase [Ligilactobacillus sp. WILCCON 0076]|uniref:Alpha/beta hydrolase n=1 Tax=Ligilactobacillus ubinensis TaxID=2876789 RepID=A0A9X2JKT3_9LACO|nr:alpha/beta hydrolase [Ligilactobacillus ubinensis]MCP0886289.1 alpha/beta hydrolase [Ligilactobacillus ubinensis]
MAIKKNLGISLLGASAAAFIFSEYLFKVAFKRIDYVPETSKDKQKYAHRYWDYVAWFKEVNKEHWTFSLNDGDDLMSAYYIPAKNGKSKKCVIIAHGYKGNGETMTGYAKMFYDMGYNILLPDDRGHGQSAGKYINFGWLDRIDYLSWLNKIVMRVGQDAKIVLFGVSMGGSTVEMMSGEKLPQQVKCIIADCGYSSINEELTYLLRQQFHLPKYPFYPLVSTINHRRLGYYLNDVSAKDQLAKNKLPIMFIHGEKDTYVPSYMALENYQATTSAKELWIVDGATHAESFWYDTKEYTRRINNFLEKYI